jgi:hypothetical protein
MLHREIIVVKSDIYIKQRTALCGQNVGSFIVKPGGTSSNH